MADVIVRALKGVLTTSEPGSGSRGIAAGGGGTVGGADFLAGGGGGSSDDVVACGMTLNCGALGAVIVTVVGFAVIVL
jgi:hypothetical protein